MAENRVGIVIEGRNKSAAAFNEVKGSLTSLDNAAKTAMGGLGGLVGALGVGALVGMATKLADATREMYNLGAAAMELDDSFAQTTQGAGMMGAGLLQALKAASNGTVNYRDLMLAVNTSLQLGVKATTDELASVMQVAQEKADALGRSTVDVFNSIVESIGTGRTRGLVSLGFDVRPEAMNAYAASLGTIASKLTEAQQQQFLLNQVIAGATQPIASAQDRIEAMKASWDNFREAAAKRVTMILEVDTTGITNGLDKATLMMNAATEIELAFRKIDTSQLEKLDTTQLFGLAPVSGAPLLDFLSQVQDAKRQADAELGKTGDVNAYNAAIEAIQRSITEFSMNLLVAAGGMEALSQVQRSAAEASIVAAGGVQQLSGAFSLLTSPLTQAAAALSAWDTTVGAAIPNLNALMNATAEAKARIQGMGLGAVDVFGASGAISNIQKYNDALQDLDAQARKYGWTTLELQAQQQVLFNEFGDQISGLRKVSTATSTYNAELSALLSTTEKFINASVSSTKGLVNFGDQGLVNGFDPNGPARDFGRMWDVAVNGFNSQWLDELRATGLIPDDVIAAGEAALKKFAEGKAQAFQSGADLGMLDTDKIVAQVKAEMDAQKELERIKAEVVNKLHEGGVTGAKATAAVDKVLGTGTGTDAGGNTAGKGFQDGFVSGLVGLGTKITTELARQMVVQAVALAAAGKDAGDKFAGGFTERAGDLPGWFLDFLTGQLTPLVEARIKANATRSQPPTGAQP